MANQETKKSRLEDLLSHNHPTLVIGIRSDGTVEPIAAKKGVPLLAFAKATEWESNLVLNLKLIDDEVKAKVPTPLEGAKFYSKEAGSFSGVEQRTVQLWTEKGLIIPLEDTTGKGRRRKYSVLNCTEIAIISSLARVGLHSKRIREVMAWLREKV